jgi:hypothetical protein
MPTPRLASLAALEDVNEAVKEGRKSMPARDLKNQTDFILKRNYILGCIALAGLMVPACTLENIEGEALLDEELTVDAGMVQTTRNDEHQLVSSDFDASQHQEILTLSDTLPEYAAKCDAAIGVTVPEFHCDAGTVIPTTNLNRDGSCDRPNRLNQECDPDSTIRVLTNTADAYVPWEGAFTYSGRATSSVGDW